MNIKELCPMPSCEGHARRFLAHSQRYFFEPESYCCTWLEVSR